MTTSPKAHQKHVVPRHRGQLPSPIGWLRRLGDASASTYRRGQLGGIPGESPFDRRREPYELLVPRIL